MMLKASRPLAGFPREDGRSPRCEFSDTDPRLADVLVASSAWLFDQETG